MLPKFCTPALEDRLEESVKYLEKGKLDLAQCPLENGRSVAPRPRTRVMQPGHLRDPSQMEGNGGPYTGRVLELEGTVTYQIQHLLPRGRFPPT